MSRRKDAKALARWDNEVRSTLDLSGRRGRSASRILQWASADLASARRAKCHERRQLLMGGLTATEPGFA